MEHVTFRQAGICDITQLVDLRIMFICENNGATTNQRTPEFSQVAYDYFSEALSNQTYFGAVAELSGQLISNAGLVLYRKPPAFVGRSGIVGYVTNVYTVPEFRNRGLATALMKLIIAHAKGAGAEKLHLGTSQEGRGIYEKLGFRDVAVPALELRI